MKQCNQNIIMRVMCQWSQYLFDQIKWMMWGNKILLFSKIYIILLLKRSSYALDILYHCKYIFLS